MYAQKSDMNSKTQILEVRQPSWKWRMFISAALAIPWILGCGLFSEYSATAHNDDWLYARSAQVLSEQGRYQHVSQHGELAASVVTHVVWGRLFVWGEFSFEALHRSQAVAGWLTCVGIAFVVLALNGNLQMALLASGSLAITPLFYGHTFTFMTDVTALMLITYAILFFIRSDNLARLGPLLVASVLTALVFWCRQTHVLIAVCPLFVLWKRRRNYSWKRLVIRLVILGGIPALSLVLFELVGLVPGNQSRTGTLFIKSFDFVRLKQIAVYLYGTGLLIGMLLLPMSAMLVLKWFGKRRLELRRRWMVLIGLAWLGVFVATGGRTYITQSVGYFLHNAHFGPVLFADLPHADGSWTYLAEVKWPPAVWQLISIASILSLAVSTSAAMTTLTTARMDQPEQCIRDRSLWRWGIFLFGLVISIALLAVVENIVDRHWMVLFVPAVIWVATCDAFLVVVRPGRVSAALMWIAGVSMIYISLTFTHDWLAFNDQRNQQMEAWLDQGLRPQDIDVGADLNGWLRTAEDYESMQREGDDTRSWRGLATHTLAHRPRRGWKVIGTRTWYSWAVETEQTLLLLKKDD